LVSPAMAEGTTTRSWPAAFHLATRRATFLIRSTEPTEVPPNFWTISAIKGAEFYRTLLNQSSESAEARSTAAAASAENTAVISVSFFSSTRREVSDS